MSDEHPDLVDPETPSEPHVLPLEDSLDLHPFRAEETALVVAEYVAAAAAAGFGEVRLIHGRGIGVQRGVVRRSLARAPKVVAFRDAPPERGGWGATIAVLSAHGRGEPGS